MEVDIMFMKPSSTSCLRKSRILEGLIPMAFEIVFASEMTLSAIKSMICRRFSSFRFRFSVFIGVLSDRLNKSLIKTV